MAKTNLHCACQILYVLGILKWAVKYGTSRLTTPLRDFIQGYKNHWLWCGTQGKWLEWIFDQSWLCSWHKSSLYKKKSADVQFYYNFLSSITGAHCRITAVHAIFWTKKHYMHTKCCTLLQKCNILDMCASEKLQFSHHTTEEFFTFKTSLV